jgi:hypothetical protein
MKYFIYDSSNDGIVWTGLNLAVGNRIKDGLLDCDLTQLSPQHESYPILTFENVQQNNLFWNGKKSKIETMPASDVNPIYLKRKQLATLRTNPMSALDRYVVWAYRKTVIFPVAGIDNDLEFELSQCQPDSDFYSYSIIEYSKICNLSPLEAYKQLRLRVNNFRSQRIRTYSYYDYFAHKINSSTTSAEIADIFTEMYKKFIKDSFI